MDLTDCGNCGATFLDGARVPVRWELPFVGDLIHRSRGQQFAIAAAFSLTIVAVLVGVLTLVGMVF